MPAQADAQAQQMLPSISPPAEPIPEPVMRTVQVPDATTRLTSMTRVLASPIVWIVSIVVGIVAVAATMGVLFLARSRPTVGS